MSMNNYRCHTQTCRVVVFKAGAHDAKCPCCKKEGTFLRPKR